MAALGVWLALWALCVSAGEPRLVCDAPAFSFGEVPVGTQTVAHGFILRNVGNAAATITNIYSGCSCTTFRLDRSVLPPGESEPLAVRLDLAGRHGSQNLSLYVNWNNPDGKPLRLSLTGMVFTAVAVDPLYVYLSDAPGTGVVERAVRIYDPSGSRAFQLTQAAAGYVGFTARLYTDTPGHEYRLVVTSSGPRRPGVITGVVKLETDQQGFPLIAVPVYIRVTGPAD